METTTLKELIGLRIVKIEGLHKESEKLTFKTSCGGTVEFYHEQDCCEEVVLVDFEGDIEDLENSVIFSAEVTTNEGEGNDSNGVYCGESFTWTLYNLQTTRGSLWLRWLGTSNGYYGEEVTVKFTPSPEVTARMELRHQKEMLEVSMRSSIAGKRSELLDYMGKAYTYAEKGNYSISSNLLRQLSEAAKALAEEVAYLKELQRGI